MKVNNEKWKELTGVDISENIKVHNEQAVKEELKHMSDKELEAFMQTVSSVYFSRMEGKALALNEGDVIKRPGNHGTCYDLIIGVRDEYISNDDYEWKVDYAAYFVDDNGRVYFRELRTYPLAESYKVFELANPNVEIIHGNYEPYEYENDLDDMMINIFNKAVRSIGA